MNKRIFLVIGVIILFIMIAIGVSTYTIIHSLIQKEKEAFKPQVENERSGYQQYNSKN